MIVSARADRYPARTSITVEMAYFTDNPNFTAALARAVQRGVDVKLVTADQADDAREHQSRDVRLALMRLAVRRRTITIVLLPDGSPARSS